MLYLDTSALLKLCRREAESVALTGWLFDHPSDWVTSALTEIELNRAVARVDAAALVHVPGVLARCDRLEIDARIRADAAELAPPELRSLDAIHLATALELSNDLAALLTYDIRLGKAAESMGLVVKAPAAE